MLITSGNIDKAFIGFDTAFQQALMNQPTVWQKIASERPSTDESEVYMWADMIGELREFLGERQIVSLSGRSQQLFNKKYEKTITIPRTKFEDDKYGVFTDQVRQIAMRAAQHPDKLVADAIAAGDTAVVYDGQYFFDTDHPQNPDDPNSPVMSNKKTGMPLSADNVAAGMALMNGYKDAGGVPLLAEPNVLMVPPALRYLARQICFGTTIAVPVGTAGSSPGGAAAPENVLKGMLDVVVNPRLTSTTKWYLLDTTKPVKPFIYQNRMAPEFAYLNKPEDAEVFKRDQFVYGVRTRGAGGYGPWFLAAEFDQ